MTGTWRRSAPVLAAVVLLGGAAAGPVAALGVRAPAVLGLAAVVAWSGRRADSRPALAVVTALVGTVSLTATAWLQVTDPVSINDPAWEPARPLQWAMVESVLLAGLIVVVVRDTPRRPAVGAASLAGVALAGIGLRLTATMGWGEQAFFTTVWAGVATGAATLGAYLRLLDATHARAVDAARRAQRLALARDLHDFVAHDVSGIVVQAQAGQVVADRAVQEALATLGRIEQAGLRALSALDRTVHLLHNDDTAATERGWIPGLDELPEVLDGFTGGGATLTMEQGLGAQVPREVGATAYRVVVEALTNVRRHAPPGATVAVEVRLAGSVLGVRVANHPGGPPGRQAHQPGRRGGLGLAGLRERVEALGGTLHAGPDPHGGWLVAATLPVGPP